MSFLTQGMKILGRFMVICQMVELINGQTRNFIQISCIIPRSTPKLFVPVGKLTQIRKMQLLDATIFAAKKVL